MIPSSEQPQHERYSVVVLDYPRREKQDIECYCIPSSQLQDHGYVPYEDSPVNEQRDDAAFSMARPRPPLSPSSKRGGWNRLWSLTRTNYNTSDIRSSGDRLSSKLRRGTRSRRKLTEEDMMRFISSQDELDWSTTDDVAPPNITNKEGDRNNSILQPLVQIYLGQGREDDGDDTVSAISHDTCWQNESQGVVELVLPNVLFCDDQRDSNQESDMENWNILFPSYIEECRENARDRQGDASKCAGAEKEVLKCDNPDAANTVQKDESNDDATASSSGWEDTLTETESENEVEDGKTCDVDKEQTNLLPVSDLSPTVEDRSTVPSLSSPSECTKFSRGPTEDLVRDMETVKQVLPSQLIIPSLNEMEANQSSIEMASNPEKLVDTMEIQKFAPIEQKSSSGEMASKPEKIQETTAIEKNVPALTEQKAVEKIFVKQSLTVPFTPKRRFLRRNNDNGEESPVGLSRSRLGALFPSPKKKPEAHEDLAITYAAEHTTCMVKEIDVLSESSLSSNLTNPSMFSSATWTPPPSPPKGTFRVQRRGSVTKFSIQNEAAPNVDLESQKNNATDVYSMAPNLSTNGSKTKESTKEGKPVTTAINHTSILGSIWKRVLSVPAIFSKCRGNPQDDNPSRGSSVAADDGGNAVSRASVSFRSLGGFSAFEDCEEGSSQWWELGSSLLVDRVPCSVPTPTLDIENTITHVRKDAGTCSSASTTVFEDAEEDDGYDEGERPCSMNTSDSLLSSTPAPTGVTPQNETDIDSQHEEQPILEEKEEDDPWSAAKRGDVEAIQKWTSDPTYDWSQKDDFGNTALFYACHSGAAINLCIVRLLLEHWPVDQIPSDVLDRCKLNALNRTVLKMLEHPEDADKISFSVLSDVDGSEESKQDDESFHLTKWLLYDVEEGDEGGDY